MIVSVFIRATSRNYSLDNILINAGITDFTPEDAPAEKEAAEKEAE